MATEYNIGDIGLNKQDGKKYIYKKGGWALYEQQQKGTRKDTAIAPNENATGDSLGEEAKIIGAEIASSIASQAAGAATLNPLTYALVSIGGGFTGSVAAQKNFGDGEVNYGRAIFNGLVAAIPFAPAVKNLTKFSTITKAMIKDAAVVEGKRGAAFGAGYEISTSPEDDGEITFSDVGKGALVGLVGGATLGTAAPWLSKTIGKHVGKSEDQINKALGRGDIKEEEAVKLLTVGNKMSQDEATTFVKKAIESVDVNAYKAGAVAEPDVGYFKNLYNSLVPTKLLGKDVMNTSYQLRKEIDADIKTGALVGQSINKAILKNPDLKKPITKFIKTGKSEGILNSKVNSALKGELEKFHETLGRVQKKLMSQLDSEDFINLSPKDQQILRNKISDSIKAKDYNTTEYELFINPNFKINNKFKAEAIKEIATRIKNDLDVEAGLKANPALKITTTEANKRATKHIDKLIEQSASNKSKNPNSNYSSSIDGVFKFKKIVGPAQRKFLGEVTDPAEIVRGTLERTGRLAHKNNADILVINSLKKMGLAVGGRADDINFVPLNLNGRIKQDLYVPKGVQEALDLSYLKVQVADDQAMIGAYKTAIAVSKATKVIFNPPSYFVNLFGGAFTTLAMGMNPAKGFLKNMSTSLKGDFPSLAQKFKGKTAEEQKAFLTNLNDAERFGLKVGNVIESDIRSGLATSNIGRKVSKAISPVGNVYAASDNALRMNVWTHNRTMLKKMFPDLPSEEIKGIAARITNDTFQNYEKLNPMLQQLSRYGVMPQFVAFTAEFSRNIFNQVKFASQMVKGTFGKEYGLVVNQANKKAMRDEGLKRLASLTAVVAVGETVRQNINLASGVTREDEERLRDTSVPEYDKNKSLIFTDVERDSNGVPIKAKYMNMTYISPHAMIADIITAATDDKPIGSVTDLVLEHFVGDGTFVSTAGYNAIQNRDAYGRQISNEVNEGKILMDKLGYFVDQSFTPGILRESNKAFDTKKAIAAGETPDLTYKDIARRQLGLRFNTLDIAESAGFKIKAFKDTANQINSRYSSARDNDNLSPENLEKEYNNANAKRTANMQKVLELNSSLQSLGYNEEQRVKVLKDANLSSREIIGILDNTITPLKKEKSITTTDIFEEEYSQLSKGDFYKQMRVLYKQKESTLAKSLIQKYKQVQREKKLKLNSKEKIFRNMSTEERADYLINNKNLYNNYRKKGLVTKGVIKEIRRRLGK